MAYYTIPMAKGQGIYGDKKTMLKPVLTKTDTTVLCVCILTIILISGAVYGSSDPGSLVRIETPEEVLLFPLDEPRTILALEDPQSCLIEITQNQVRVIESGCPNQICISMGSLPAPGNWIACLPHGVFISLEGDTDDLLLVY